VEIRIIRGVEISLRDKVRLVGDVHLPRSAGPFPSIVFRTPYGRDDENYRRYARFFSSNGFAFLNSDVRGRGDSEGTFVPYFNEGKDGKDVIDWVANQSWSNGKIGTFGASYSARIQWLTALEGPRNLLAMISKVSPSDPFVESPTGVNDPMHISWRYLVSGRTLKNTEDIDWDSVYRTLPLKYMPRELGLDLPDWEEDLSHQTFDKYWDAIGYQKRFEKIDVPTMHISGWYDDEQIGTFINYVGMRKKSASPRSRDNQSIVIGPWGHNVNSTPKLGDVDFGPGAIIDLDSLQLNWFRRWLVDENVSVGKRAKIFIMGENRWVDFEDWPPVNVSPSKLYLTSNGRANSRFGDGSLVWNADEIVDGKDEYKYDPSDPTPFVTEITSSQIGGPDNYSSVERRDDILVYTSPRLERDITFLGAVNADIFMETDVPDTDIMAMLLDVWPNGYAQRMCDGMTRGRYRRGMDSTELLESDKVHEFEVDLWNTGHTFAKGHSIRVSIASAAFPKYSRNLNTGLDLASDATMRVANTRIIHSKRYPTSLSFFLYD
jgi:putative CocE/NonD family hydrolase